MIVTDGAIEYNETEQSFENKEELEDSSDEEEEERIDDELIAYLENCGEVILAHPVPYDFH